MRDIRKLRESNSAKWRKPLINGGADGRREPVQVIEKKALSWGNVANCPPKCPHVRSALLSLQQISMDFTEIPREHLRGCGSNFTATATAHSRLTCGGCQPDTRLELQPIGGQRAYTRP